MTQTVLLKNAEMMMAALEVDLDRRVIKVRFVDGQSGEIPAEAIERAGRPVHLDLNHVSLPNPYVIIIGVEGQSEPEEVPWDFARHFCDPTFEAQERRKAETHRKRLGERIKRLRQQRGVSQEQLAEEAGVGRITLSRIETGHEQSPRFDTLERIAKALGVGMEGYAQ
jgi:DNA-binding XRE family transcriptional regulator